MEQRQPLIDVQTWETLKEIYQLIDSADRDGTALASTDLAYISAMLKSLLRFNSQPDVDPRAGARFSDRVRGVKEAAKSLLP